MLLCSAGMLHALLVLAGAGSLQFAPALKCLFGHDLSGKPVSLLRIML
jgi:hypothetical protein